MLRSHSLQLPVCLSGALSPLPPSPLSSLEEVLGDASEQVMGDQAFPRPAGSEGV